MHFNAFYSPTQQLEQKLLQCKKCFAAIVERKKINKYRETIEANGGLFEPFIIELYGRWGISARENIFKPLLTKLEDNGWDRGIASHYWTRRITMASMVTGMRLLLNRAAGLAADKEYQEDYKSLLKKTRCSSLALYQSLLKGIRYMVILKG